MHAPRAHPALPAGADHILDGEAVLEEFLNQADERGKVLCSNADGDMEPSEALCPFTYRYVGNRKYYGYYLDTQYFIRLIIYRFPY